MEQILCIYCGDLFDPSPRHKGRTSCKKPECKRAKKADWQRHKMQTDPIYSSNQKVSQKEWARANPGYWRQYRKRNPEKAERNRILQAIRNRKARSSHPVAKMDAINRGPSCRRCITIKFFPDMFPTEMALMVLQLVPQIYQRPLPTANTKQFLHEGPLKLENSQRKVDSDRLIDVKKMRRTVIVLYQERCASRDQIK